MEKKNQPSEALIPVVCFVVTFEMASTLICAVTLSSETLPVGPDAGESKTSQTSPTAASSGLCLSPQHRQGVTQEPRMSHWLTNKSGGNSQKKGVNGQQWETHKSIGRHQRTKGFFLQALVQMCSEALTMQVGNKDSAITKAFRRVAAL